MTTEERIQEDADKYGESFKTGEWFENLRINAFTEGAKSERNKTIDEAIDIVTDYQDYNPLIIERLKAMKI